VRQPAGAADFLTATLCSRFSRTRRTGRAAGMRSWFHPSACIAMTRATPLKLYGGSTPVQGSDWSSRSIRPNPAMAETIADWVRARGTVDIRIFLRDNLWTDPADPAINHALATASQPALPVNVACTGRLEQARELAVRNPNTQLVIDPLDSSEGVRSLSHNYITAAAADRAVADVQRDRVRVAVAVARRRVDCSCPRHRCSRIR
jgi:hypothetical protein